MQLLILLFSSSLFYQSLSFAGEKVENQITEDQCASSDLSKQLGPIRFQGSAENCFGFVAADLIGYHERINNDQISALDVTANAAVISPDKLYSIALSTKDLQTMFIARIIAPILIDKSIKFKGKLLSERMSTGGSLWAAVMKYSGKKHLCLESQVPSQGSQARSDTYKFLATEVENLESARGSKNIFPHSNYENAKSFSCTELNNIGSLMSEKDKMNEAIVSGVVDDINHKCLASPPINSLNAGFWGFDAGEKSFASVLTLGLLKNNVPVGVQFASSYFETGIAPDNAIIDHAVVVAGSRWNKKRNICELKIRNSWGINCARYNPSIQPDCDAGNIWIPTATFNKLVDGLVAIEPVKK